MVSDSSSARSRPAVAPSSEIRLGLEWVDGRDGRDERARGRATEPIPQRLPGTGLLLPPAADSEEQLAPALEPQPRPLVRQRSDEHARRAPPQKPEPRRDTPEPRRDSPERVLERYLGLVHENERLEKAFGYGRFRPDESLLAWSDPELPILLRDREQFGGRLDCFGHRMFFRPAEKSLAELDFYRDARLGIQDVKGRVFTPDNGPGAWTARFRGQNPSEMVEISYRLGGARIGSTAGSLRASCDTWICSWLRLEVGSRFPYSGEGSSAGGGLHCYLSRFLELHLVGSTQTNRDMLPSLFMLGDPTEPLSLGCGMYMSYRF